MDGVEIMKGLMRLECTWRPYRGVQVSEFRVLPSSNPWIRYHTYVPRYLQLFRNIGFDNGYSRLGIRACAFNVPFTPPIRPSLCRWEYEFTQSNSLRIVEAKLPAQGSSPYYLHGTRNTGGSSWAASMVASTVVLELEVLKSSRRTT